MVYRSRDICSAAFFDDTQRLRLLTYQEAPGGLDYRFDLARFLALANFGSNNPGGSGSGGADGSPSPADVLDGEEEEEVEFEEEQEAAVEADSELARLRTLYSLEEEEIDGVDEEGDNDGDDDLYDPAVIEADMEAQEADFNRYKRLLRHQLREAAIATALNVKGRLITGDSAADLETFGILFTAKELPSMAGRGPRTSDAAETDESDPLALSTPLMVRWLPMKSSPYAASALHWAVLGRAHEAVRFLVGNGIDVTAEVGQDTDKKCPATSAFAFPAGLTADRMAAMNASAETLRVLRDAVAAREAFLHAFDHAKQQVEGSLEQRKARQEKRRLGREQRRVAREELHADAEEDEEGSAMFEEGEERNSGDNNADDGRDTDNGSDY